MSVYMLKVAYINLYLQYSDADDTLDDPTTTPPLTPYIFDLNCGWVGTGNGVWTYENPTKSFSDIYRVLGGHTYFLTLGDTVGTRFRVMFATRDVSNATGTVTGVAVNKNNYNNPAPHQNLWYTPNDNGYLIIQKDNVGVSGIQTYLYDATISHISSYPLCRVNPDSCDNSKIAQIITSLLPCFDEAVQLKAVKKIEGYKIIVT